MKSNIYFKRDLYAVENDRSLRSICKKYPVWGEAVFFSAICMMYRTDGENYEINNLIDDVADALYTDNKEKVEEIIDACIQVRLFKMEYNRIWSDRVKKTCEEQKRFIKSQSEKGKKSAEKRLQNKYNSENNLSNTGSTVVKPMLNTGSTYNKDQEKNNKEKEILSNDNIPKKKVCSDLLFSPEKEKDTTPYNDIIAYWNKGAIKAGLSQFMKMTEPRKKAIRCRWNEYSEKVYEAIDKVFASDFCKSGNWCGFDWVFKPSNMVKILEGKYDNKTSSRGFKKDVTGRYDNLESEVIEL